MILRARDYKFDFGKKTFIMGIVNLTPDSFSGDGTYRDIRKSVNKIIAFEKEGADIVDLGAESTRPGAKKVSPAIQSKRILPVLEKIIGRINIPISIDTTSSVVAKRCLELGASIINDISGLKEDPRLGAVVAEHKAGIVLMHMRGNPRNMQKKTHYRNLIRDIIKEISESVDIALKSGVKYDQIIIDPGIGFAKTKEQNLKIIRYLGQFKKFRRPVLIGPSRKSFIGSILGRDVNGRIFGTAASVSLSIAGGADIVRVHDVSEMRDVARVSDAVLNSN